MGSGGAWTMLTRRGSAGVWRSACQAFAILTPSRAGDTDVAEDAGEEHLVEQQAGAASEEGPHAPGPAYPRPLLQEQAAPGILNRLSLGCS